MRIIENMVAIEINKTEYTALFNNLDTTLHIVKTSEFEHFRNSKHIEMDDTRQLFRELYKKKFIMSEVRERNTKARYIDNLKKNNILSFSNSKFITLIVTYDCNFQCSYCFETCKEKSTLSRHQIDVIAENHTQLNQIRLFGGEPLLIENREIIEYILNKFKSCNFHIITNGYYLEEYSDLLAHFNMFLIEVSLDGPPEIHDLSRQHNGRHCTSEKIINGVTYALEMGLKVRLHFNFKMVNYAKVIDYIRSLEKKFEKYIKKNLLTFMVTPLFQENALQNDNGKVILLEDRIDNELLKTSYIPIVNALTSNKKLTAQVNYCYAQRGHFIYDPQGQIYSCLTKVGTQDGIVGTYNQNVKVNLANPYYTRTIDTLENCSNCLVSTFCGGGCPNNTQINMGDCSHFKYYINNIIPELIRKKLENKNV